MKKHILLLLILLLLPLSLRQSIEYNAVNILVYDPLEVLSRYERLFELLEENGFKVTIFRKMEIGRVDLKGYRVILMYDYTVYSSKFLDNTTLRNIENFVENGGGIFLLTLPGQSRLTDLANILVTRYLLTDDKNMLEYLGDKSIPIYNRFGLNEIGMNVSRVAIPYSLALKCSGKSIPVVLVNNSTVAIDVETNQEIVGNFTPIAASYIGRGRIIASGSTDIFFNFYIYSEDNPQFIINMFNWLAGRKHSIVVLKSNVNRMYFNITIGIALLLISSLIVAFFYKVRLAGKRMLGIPLLVFLIYLSLIGVRWMDGYTVSWHHYVMLILLTIYIAALYLLWDKFTPVLRESMLKLMGATAISYLLPLTFLGYCLFQNPPSPIYETTLDRVSMALDIVLRIYGSIVITTWIGLPFLWLLFRRKYEEKLIYPHVIGLDLPPEGYEKIFYQDFYSNYIFKALAVFLFARICPGIILVIYALTWGGKSIPVEWINIVQTNAVLIFSVVVAIFTLRKAVEYGLTDKDKIIELRNLMFLGELPYTFIMLFTVPALVNSLISMEFNIDKIVMNGLSPFLGFIVGYIAVKIYQSGMKSFISSVLVGIIILVYQFIINSTLLKPVLSFLQQSSINTILTILISVGFKKIYKDFEKSLTAKKKPPPPPV